MTELWASPTDPLIAVSVSDRGSLDFTNSNTARCWGCLLEAHGSFVSTGREGGERHTKEKKHEDQTILRFFCWVMQDGGQSKLFKKSICKDCYQKFVSMPQRATLLEHERPSLQTSVLHCYHAKHLSVEWRSHPGCVIQRDLLTVFKMKKGCCALLVLNSVNARQG